MKEKIVNLYSDLIRFLYHNKKEIFYSSLFVLITTFLMNTFLTRVHSHTLGPINKTLDVLINEPRFVWDYYIGYFSHHFFHNFIHFMFNKVIYFFGSTDFLISTYFFNNLFLAFLALTLVAYGKQLGLYKNKIKLMILSFLVMSPYLLWMFMVCENNVSLYWILILLLFTTIHEAPSNRLIIFTGIILGIGFAISGYLHSQMYFAVCVLIFALILKHFRPYAINYFKVFFTAVITFSLIYLYFYTFYHAGDPDEMLRIAFNAMLGFEQKIGGEPAFGQSWYLDALNFGSVGLIFRYFAFDSYYDNSVGLIIVGLIFLYIFFLLFKFHFSNKKESHKFQLTFCFMIFCFGIPLVFEPYQAEKWDLFYLFTFAMFWQILACKKITRKFKYPIIIYMVIQGGISLGHAYKYPFMNWYETENYSHFAKFREKVDKLDLSGYEKIILPYEYHAYEWYIRYRFHHLFSQIYIEVIDNKEKTLFTLGRKLDGYTFQSPPSTKAPSPFSRDTRQEQVKDPRAIYFDRKTYRMR